MRETKGKSLENMETLFSNAPVDRDPGSRTTAFELNSLTTHSRRAGNTSGKGISGLATVQES